MLGGENQASRMITWLYFRIAAYGAPLTGDDVLNEDAEGKSAGLIL